MKDELGKMEKDLRAKIRGEEVKETTPEQLTKEKMARAKRSEDLEF